MYQTTLNALSGLAGEHLGERHGGGHFLPARQNDRAHLLIGVKINMRVCLCRSTFKIRKNTHTNTYTYRET